VESPFSFIADNFPTFPAGNWFYDFVVAIGFHYWLIAEIGIPPLIHSNGSRKPFPLSTE
jgi:hypothetical protein